jgi:tetratricopeptide (TPR) repeat protein
MHFYYGELLYDLGKYDEASQQYRWIVDNGPKSKFYDKAGVNLILAAEKSIPTDKELQARVGTSVEARPLDPRVERFIKAAQWHLEKFPNSERNPEVKFRIGRLYYLHNQFDEANKSFKDIVKNHPRSKYSEYSANLNVGYFQS